MKHVKNMLYDMHGTTFIDKKLPLIPLLMTFLLFAAAVSSITAAVTEFQWLSVTGRLPWILASAAFIAMFIPCLCYTVHCFRFPYNAVLDDEHLFVRKGSGYLKFHKFEIGSVVYRDEESESAVSGHGGDHFLIFPGRITFQNAIRPIRRRIKNGEKLAYMLMNAVQNPHSGVDWSLAYDSLPAAKRSPGAF